MKHTFKILVVAFFEIQSLAGQNVGIGTTMPAFLLHAVSGNSNAEVARIESSGGIGNMLVGNGNMFADIGVTGTIGYCGTNSAQDFALRTGNTNRMYFKHQNGFAGIGTMYPEAMLHVNGSGRIEGSLGVGTPNSLARLQLFEATSSPMLAYFEGEGGLRYIMSSNGINASTMGSTVEYAFAGTLDPTDYALIANGVPRFHIEQTNGFIGIGTSTPLKQLHVEGSMYLSYRMGIGTGSPQHILDVQAANENEIAKFRNTTADNANINVTNGISAVDFGLNNVGGYVGTVSAGDFRIRTNYTVRMYFRNTDGFVGINTQAPTQQLDVAGNIALSGHIMTDPAVNATLINGWFIYDSSFGTPQYSKDKQGRILLSGLAEHTPVNGGIVFVLPVGYRPEKSMYFLAATDHPNGFNKILINHTNGEVSVTTTGSNITWVSFDNITFRAAP